MSEIRVDSIKDAAGTGSPDFTNGLKIGGSTSIDSKGVFQIKKLTADVTTNTTVSDLTFSTTIGAVYRLHLHSRWVVINANAPTLTIKDGITNIGYINNENATSSPITDTEHLSLMYTATGTSLTFVTASIGTSTLQGNNDQLETYAILERVYDSSEGTVT